MHTMLAMGWEKNEEEKVLILPKGIKLHENHVLAVQQAIDCFTARDEAEVGRKCSSTR